MQRVPVQSSNVISVGYAAETEILEVEFKGGVVWHYNSVPAERFEAITSAESIGKAINAAKKEFTGVKGPAPEMVAPISMSIAEALSKLADKHGVSVEGVAKDHDLLESAGISPKKVTPKTIAKAKAIDRTEMAAIQARVDALNKPILEAEKKAVEEVIFHHIKKPALTLGEILSQVASGDMTLDKAQELLVLKAGKTAPEKPAPTKTPAKSTQQTTNTAPKAGRSQLFGYSATAVMRWMGANGWSFDKAMAAFTGMGVDDLSETTFKIQLRAGVKGERGDPAPVTDKQAKELEAAASK